MYACCAEDLGISYSMLDFVFYLFDVGQFYISLNIFLRFSKVTAVTWKSDPFWLILSCFVDQMTFNLRLIHSWSFRVLTQNPVNYIFSRQNGGKRHFSWLCLTSEHCPLLSFCSSFSVLCRFLHTDQYSGAATEDVWNSLLMHLLFYVKPLALPDLSFILSIQEFLSPSVSSLPTYLNSRNFKGKDWGNHGIDLAFFPIFRNHYTSSPHVKYPESIASYIFSGFSVDSDGRWEEGLRGRGHLYTYGTVMLM